MIIRGVCPECKHETRIVIIPAPLPPDLPPNHRPSWPCEACGTICTVFYEESADSGREAR